MKRKYKNNYLKLYECADSGEKFGLLAVNGKMKDAIIQQLQANMQLQGDYVCSGGMLSDLCVPSLLVGGSGAMGLSAAASGTLFVATANPATLMTLGNGVGSAVMGAKGIIAQAPFVPVSGALTSVITPLLAFQALSTVMVLQQFRVVNESLDRIQQKVSRILQRSEAVFVGELLSASARIESLEAEYNITNRFSSDMITRLALLEGKINALLERYKYLYDGQRVDAVQCVDDINFKASDAYMVTLLSVLDLRIDVLRLKLTLQENPAFLNTLAKSLISKTAAYQQLWNEIEHNPKQVEEFTNTLQDTIQAMNIWQKYMPEWLGGKRERRKANETVKSVLTEANTRARTDNIVETARNAAAFGDALADSVQHVGLLYWEDDSGKHSYYTNDLLIT